MTQRELAVFLGTVGPPVEIFAFPVRFFAEIFGWSLVELLMRGRAAIFSRPSAPQLKHKTCKS